MAGTSNDETDKELRGLVSLDYCELSAKNKRLVNNAARDICRAINDRLPAGDAPIREVTGREIIHALGLHLNKVYRQQRIVHIRKLIKDKNNGSDMQSFIDEVTK